MKNEVMQIFIGMVCGTIEEDGQVTDVVAAGVGSQGNTVSIYNIESGAWRTGMVNLGTCRCNTSTHVPLSYRGESSYADLVWCLCAISRQFLNTRRVLQ